MKTAKRLVFSKNDLKKLEDQLAQFVYDNLFKEVFALLEDNELINDEPASPIVEAIRSGKIYFDGRGFRAKDKFGVKLAKEFRKLKAILKNGRYELPNIVGDPEIEAIKTEVKVQQDKVQAKIKAIESFLISKKTFPEFNDGSIISEMVEKLTAQVNTAFGVQYDFTPEDKQFFVDSYIKNAALYTDKLTKKANAELKAYVLAEASQLNLTTKSLAKVIEERFGVAERHAKFIARQEAHMARERINQNTAQNLGFNHYIWQTVGDYRVRPAGYGTAEGYEGDNHRRLNGKVFSFDDPPYVDRIRGRKCNPGEDFNCRCTARVIISDDYYEL